MSKIIPALLSMYITALPFHLKLDSLGMPELYVAPRLRLLVRLYLRRTFNCNNCMEPRSKTAFGYRLYWKMVGGLAPLPGSLSAEIKP